MFRFFKEFAKGLWKENPTLVLVLGTCPTLAVTSNAINGMSMGLATTFVLTLSNIAISCIAGIVPKKIRIPVYIMVIATFVSVVEMLMHAYAPAAICESLGIFIPLIVVNCIVLGRAEAFAAKNNPLLSAADGLGMGIGFTLALGVMGGIREFLTSGSLFGVKLITGWTTDFLLPCSATGAFIVFGCLLAAKNALNLHRAVKKGELYIPPAGMDCRHCHICDLNKE